MDIILPFLTHPPCMDSFYILSMDKNRHFLTPSPPHLVHVVIECPLRWTNTYRVLLLVKFIYSEKATKFCEIFTLLLTDTTYDKSKVKILQNFVTFSEYMNFNYVDKMSGRGGQKMSVFVHAQGIKTVHTGWLDQKMAKFCPRSC